ncbi:MAG: phage terminase large subunit, partial [Chloroflexi bacterium]|nr:phage terminase large subunit [Chloroflexota bacterium]
QEGSKFNRGFMITHVHRERLTPSKKLNLIYQYRNDRMPNIVLIEDRGPGKEVIQEIESRDTDAMPQLRKTDPKGYGDKVARARAQQSVFERGLIWVPEHAPWVADFLDEVSSFPASAFDDQVDALSQALAYMRTEMLPSSASDGPRSWMNRSNQREDDRTAPPPPPGRRLRVM